MRMNDGQPHRKRLTATKVAPYIFIAPAVTYFVCMSIIPIVMALPISLTDWSALTPDRNFVGLENYRKLLTDGEFWRSCLTMLKFFLYVPLVMLLGLGAAMLLNTGVRGMKFFRVLFYSRLSPPPWRRRYCSSGSISPLLGCSIIFYACSGCRPLHGSICRTQHSGQSSSLCSGKTSVPAC